MAYIDEFGVVHSIDNSFFTLLGRAFSSLRGLSLIFIPLIVLIGLFFLIKNKTNKKLIIIGYIVGALILYFIYSFIILRIFFARV